MLILLVLIGRLTRGQPSTAAWTEVDAPNDVWQRGLEDGAQEFIALPHPPYVMTRTAGQGAAWGGRIEHDRTLSNWFTLQYMGLSTRGVEVVMSADEQCAEATDRGEVGRDGGTDNGLAHSTR